MRRKLFFCFAGVECFLGDVAQESRVFGGDSLRNEFDFGGRLVEEECVPEAGLEVFAAAVQMSGIVAADPADFSGFPVEDHEFAFIPPSRRLGCYHVFRKIELEL